MDDGVDSQAAPTLAQAFVVWLRIGLLSFGSQARLRGALTAITAAVVGVILNLSIWFALHVFFTQVSAQHYGPLVLWQPALDSLDWRVIVLAVLSATLLFRFHWGISRVLVLASLGGLVLTTFFA